VKKSSLLLLLVLTMIGSLAASDYSPVVRIPTDPGEELYLGLGEGTPGKNGWVVSDFTIHVISPTDTLVNGKPLQDGRFTITSDGRHSVELQPGPSGQENTVTQFINIDKTAPTVEWTTQQNAVVSDLDTLIADLSDETSGLCGVESSFDHGQNWEVNNLAPMTPNGVTIHHEMAWSIHEDFRGFPPGAQVVLLRARDCAGNASPGEILVFRVEQGK
jgi:hypothetical protein